MISSAILLDDIIFRTVKNVYLFVAYTMLGLLGAMHLLMGISIVTDPTVGQEQSRIIFERAPREHTEYGPINETQVRSFVKFLGYLLIFIGLFQLYLFIGYLVPMW